MTKFGKWKEKSSIFSKFWHNLRVEFSKSNRPLIIKKPRHIWAEKLAVWAELCLAE